MSSENVNLAARKDTSLETSTPQASHELHGPIPETMILSLLSDIKVTKGSRFNAAERLRRKDRSSTYATAYLSSLVIIITICAVIFPALKKFDDWITLVTITFSLLIIVFSLLQYSSNDAVKAELHHRCGMELNALRHEIQTCLADRSADVAILSKTYDEILQRYAANHEPVDFERYKLEHPSEFPAQTEADKAAIKKDVRNERNFPLQITRSLTFGMIVVAIPIVGNVGGEFIYHLFQTFQIPYLITHFFNR